MQISFVMLIFLLFSDQISGGGKSPREGKLPRRGGGALWKKESQLFSQIGPHNNHLTQLAIKLNEVG